MRGAFNDFIARHEVAWELAMGALAILYLAVGFTAEGRSDPTMAVVETALTVVFVLEFSVRFGASLDRRAYLRSHWIDLVALIPVVRQFRLLRLLRLLRLVRTFAGIYRALLHVDRILGHRHVATVGVIWFAILLLTSFGMFIAENGVNDAVASPMDALWWGVTTMTTVGYGDVYPITPEGRLAAAILMVLGIALFGVITATVTGILVRSGTDGAAGEDPTKQISRLFALVETGAVTPEEFAAKKQELLARI